MILLPIAERELRTAARKPQTYRSRLYFCLTLFAFLLLYSGPTLFGARTVGIGGSQIFIMLSTLCGFYVFMAALRNGADTIACEKREGTLGLLFLTDLKGYDIILGKMASLWIHSFYPLLGGFIVLAFPLFLGGVTPGEVFRTMLALSVMLMVMTSIAITASVYCFGETKAFFVVGLALMASVILPLTATGFNLNFPGNYPKVLLFSTVSTLPLATESLYRLSGGFWLAISIQLGLVLLFIAIASHRVVSLWSQGETTKSFGWTDALRKRTARRLRPLLDKDPVYWLSIRKSAVVILLLFSGVMLISSQLLTGRGEASTVSSLGTFVIKLYLVWLACRSLVQSRKNGALELLLTTKLSEQDIVRGHFRALARFAWCAFAVVGSFMVISSILAVVSSMGWYGSPQKIQMGPLGVTTSGLRSSDFLVTEICALLQFGTDLWAICWVGLWAGLKSKNLATAIFRVYLWVTIIPATGLFGFLFLFGLNTGANGILTTVVLQAVLWVSKNYLLVKFSRARLGPGFRAEVAKATS